jgi:hypothetical protein
LGSGAAKRNLLITVPGIMLPLARYNIHIPGQPIGKFPLAVAYCNPTTAVTVINYPYC